MKLLNVLIIVMPLYYFNSYGQSRLYLYGYNSCDSSVINISHFGLTKDGLAFSAVDSSGYVLLNEVGIYILDYVLEDIDTSQLRRKYNIETRNGIYRDTLNLISIIPCLTPTSHPDFIGFCCCDEKCEGKQVDFYANGNKRIEGCFKEGVPWGDIKSYYPNGKLRRVDKYRRGKLRKSIFYNKNSEITDITKY